MKDYSNYYPSRRDRRRYKTTQNFLIHYRESNEGCEVYVNGDKTYRLPVIIKDHTNPINNYLEDKKMYFLNAYEEKSINWGDEIIINGSEKYEDGTYLVITRPDTDGYESKCRIRKMHNRAQFTVCGKEYQYNCIKADGLLYNASAYVNEVNVFTEEDLKAILIRYDENTSRLKLFDDVILDGVLYKVSKVDNYTLKRYNEQFGVVQMVLIRTIFGDMSVNGKAFNGIMRYARLKERVYNSKAREVLTKHNILKSGDYVAHTFLRDEEGNYETRIYIVRSLVDMRNEYDTSFVLNCDAEFYMKNIKDVDQEKIMIPAYFEDNRIQLQVNERNSNALIEGSKYQCLVQNNAHTKLLGKEVSRIIIKGDAYRIVGVDKLSLEGAIYVGLMDSKINPSTDNLELGIADYYKSKNNNLDVVKDTEIIGDKEILFGDSGIYYLKDGIDWKDAEWNIVGSQACTIFSVVENKCIIEVQDSSLLIGKKIQLQVKINGGSVYVKDIEIVGW